MKLDIGAIEALSEGVVELDAQARLLFLNANAARMLNQRIGDTVANPLIRRAIEAVTGGYDTLPLVFPANMEADECGNADEMAVSLHQGEEAGRYVVLLRSVAEEKLFNTSLENLLEFVQAVLGARLNALAVALAGTESALRGRASGDPLAAAAEELVFRAYNVTSALTGIVELADLGSADLRHDTQRVSPVELANEALAEIARKASQRGLWLTRSGFDGHFPPLYGSRGWLRRALVAHLEHFVEASDSASGIEIKLKHIEGYVLFIVRGLGRGFPAAVKGQTFIPFSREAQNENGAGERLPRLGLALARSIVERHGGKIKREATGSTASLVIELPVRLPDTPEPGLEQALRYAEELKTLIKERQANR